MLSTQAANLNANQDAQFFDQSLINVVILSVLVITLGMVYNSNVLSAWNGVYV